MKGLGSVIIIAMSIWLFQRCGDNSKNNRETDDDSITVIKNTNPAGDTSVKRGIPAEHGDIQFVIGAASGGETEVMLGNLAKEKALDKRIKNFGAMMVKDHSKLNVKLQALAKAKNIQLPITPLTADQNTIDALKRKTGKDFDKAYVSNMIKDHQTDIKQFEIAAKNCQDPDIKAFARKTLATLRNHLDAINTINQGME